ncbi:MAG: cytochrome P450 [Sulfitobacter sp.]
MRNAPVFDIDPKAFWLDPYPDLAAMRAKGPVHFVPQLDATLVVRRDDIFVSEKKIAYFSSNQPQGLMTRLMGQNMMRKDGAAHMAERKAIFPAVSPRTVRDVWKAEFEQFTAEILHEIRPLGRADMVKVIAMRISGEALKVITGLRNMSWQEMDRVSQGMIDGCANYAGDPAVEARCHECTASIDRHIDEMIPALQDTPDQSLLCVQMQAGLPLAQARTNIKLAISGGQNEPRDVIAGMVWALLSHPEQLALVKSGEATWMQAFEEYTRWQSPIGMTPREMAQDYDLHGVTLKKGERVFFMFASANRDERAFQKPDVFDITQDASASIAFGAGPHFCAGAWASRCLVGEVALPMIFEHLPDLALSGDIPFGGWAFRGPLSCSVTWDAGKAPAV